MRTAVSRSGGGTSFDQATNQREPCGPLTVSSDGGGGGGGGGGVGGGGGGGGGGGTGPAPSLGEFIRNNLVLVLGAAGFVLLAFLGVAV